MRGGMFHEYMIEVLERAFNEKGLRTRRQVPSKKGRTTGYIDLLVYSNDSRVLVVEVEMNKRRAINDTRKQKDFGTDTMLWIVTPTQRMAQSIKQHLRYRVSAENNKTFVLSFGAALKRIEDKNPFCFGA